MDLNRLRAWSQGRATPIAAFAFYVVVTAIAGVLHEPWRDEADSWLVVRDRSFTELFPFMGYAGTPGLWYLLLFPLAKLGLPYAAQFVLHWIIAAAAAFVILFFVPARPWLRVLLVGNGLVGFEYAVIARSYALTILFTALLVALYARRVHRPKIYGFVLLLLANTNVMGLFITCGVLAGLATGLLFEHRKQTFIAAWIGFSGVLLAALQLWPPKDGQNPQFVPHDMFTERFFGATAAGLVPYWGITKTSMAFGIVCMLATIVAVRRSAFASAFLFTTGGMFFYLFAFKHLGELRHHAFVFVCLLVAHALAGPRLARRASYVSMGLLCACLLLWSAKGAETLYLEATRPFSSAEEAATWLNKQKLKKRTLVGYPQTVASAVLPWLSRSAWYPQIGKHGTHMEWNEVYIRGMSVGLAQAVQRVHENIPKWRDPKQGMVLLSGAPWGQADQYGFELVFQTKGAPFRAIDEKYWIYAPKGAGLKK